MKSATTAHTNGTGKAKAINNVDAQPSFGVLVVITAASLSAACRDQQVHD